MWPFSKKKKNIVKNLSPEEKSRALREEAMANARAARERLGEETLDEVAKAIQRMEERKRNDVSTKAKHLIDKEGGERAASHIRGLMDKDN